MGVALKRLWWHGNCHAAGATKRHACCATCQGHVRVASTPGQQSAVHVHPQMRWSVGHIWGASFGEPNSATGHVSMPAVQDRRRGAKQSPLQTWRRDRH